MSYGLPVRDDYLESTGDDSFNITPVWEELLVDLETPISIFMKDCLPENTPTCWRAWRAVNELARYSFMGFDPLVVFQAKGTTITIGRDPELLDALIEQYQHRLLRYLLHLTGNRAVAEDLLQYT